jgi:hypothetical protein
MRDPMTTEARAHFGAGRAIWRACWIVRALPLVLSGAFWVAPSAARADDTPAWKTVRFAAGRQPEDLAGDRWQAALGMRTSWIRSAGFDPFSDNDALAQGSLAVTRALDLGLPALSLVLGLSLDLGHSDAVTRAIDADLDLQRTALVLEPRYLLAPGVYIGLRLAPGLQHLSASLHDRSAPSALAAAFWVPSVDASLTAGARLNPAAARVGVWLLAEGGYGWSPARDLTLSPELPPGDASKAGAISLGTLSARGPFLRISLALGY